MPALYRTYRPKTLSQVVGQAPIVQTLRNTIRAGTPAHAYLFCGSRGLGKTTLARVLARSLNCSQPLDGEACLLCETCQAFDEGRFMDLVEIDAASNTGVDNIRGLVDTVGFRPVHGKYKVYIIDEAHMLSKGAWNALLKTLEEPPEHVVFVLATTESGKVPETINSRAQRFEFVSFTGEEITRHLQDILNRENQAVSAGALEVIAKSSGGSMRDALTLLDQVLSLGSGASLEDIYKLLGVTEEQVYLELFSLVSGGKLEAMPKFFEELESSALDMQALNRDFLEFLRDKLKTALLARDTFELGRLTFVIRLFLRSYKDLSFSPDPVLPLLLASLEAGQKYVKSESANGSIKYESKEPESPKMKGTEVKKKLDEVTSPKVAVAPEVMVERFSESVAEIELHVLESRWPEVCQYIKEVNSPLATLVRNSKLKSTKNSTVFLEVKYLFHKEQLESAKNRELIQQTLYKVFGVMLACRGIVEEKQDLEPSLSDALKVFGGELID